MDEKKTIKSIATALVSQYGDDAVSIAMLRAAEYAASFNTEEWIIWEAVINEINEISSNPKLQ